MPIILNHTIVPARNARASGELLARLFAVPMANDGHFTLVRINRGLTFLFETRQRIESQHYAFHVSDEDFDAILARVKDAGLAFGSGPDARTDGRLNGWNGGRGVYFDTPDSHVLELMTVPQ